MTLSSRDAEKLSTLLRKAADNNGSEGPQAINQINRILHKYNSSIDKVADNPGWLLGEGGSEELQQRLNEFIDANRELSRQNDAISRENQRLRQFVSFKDIFEKVSKYPMRGLRLSSFVVFGPAGVGLDHYRNGNRGTWDNISNSQDSGTVKFLLYAGSTVAACAFWFGSQMIERMALDDIVTREIENAVISAPCEEQQERSHLVSTMCPELFVDSQSVLPSIGFGSIGLLDEQSAPLIVNMDRVIKYDQVYNNDNQTSGHSVCVQNSYQAYPASEYNRLVLSNTEVENSDPETSEPDLSPEYERTLPWVCQFVPG